MAPEKVLCLLAFFSTWLACYLLISNPDIKCNHILRSHRPSERGVAILHASGGVKGSEGLGAFLSVKNTFESHKETRLRAGRLRPLGVFLHQGHM